MRFNIITNISNGAGLQRDYELIRGMLEKMGHKVTGVQFDQTAQFPPEHGVDVNIFMEIITPQIFSAAQQNWFIPNSEWYFPCWDGCLNSIGLVLCKTRDCLNIWNRKVGNRAKYLGFESNDFFNPQTKRIPEFLHMAGKSETKNTATVTEAWKTYKIPYPLTVVAFKPEIVRHCTGIQNVKHITRLTNEEVADYMNRFQFHIMPSKYEGYGHYIHEAMSCQGVVLTTDAAPMNDFAGIPKELLIPVQRKEAVRAAYFNHVSPLGVAAAVRKAMELSPIAIEELGNRARIGFLSEREQFRKTFETLVRNGGR